jgi:hypothetical protein
MYSTVNRMFRISMRIICNQIGDGYCYVKFKLHLNYIRPVMANKLLVFTNNLYFRGVHFLCLVTFWAGECPWSCRACLSITSSHNVCCLHQRGRVVGPSILYSGDNGYECLPGYRLIRLKLFFGFFYRPAFSHTVHKKRKTEDGLLPHFSQFIIHNET